MEGYGPISLSPLIVPPQLQPPWEGKGTKNGHRRNETSEPTSGGEELGGGGYLCQRGIRKNRNHVISFPSKTRPPSARPISSDDQAGGGAAHSLHLLRETEQRARHRVHPSRALRLALRPEAVGQGTPEGRDTLHPEEPRVYCVRHYAEGVEHAARDAAPRREVGEGALVQHHTPEHPTVRPSVPPL